MPDQHPSNRTENQLRQDLVWVLESPPLMQVGQSEHLVLLKSRMRLWLEHQKDLSLLHDLLAQQPSSRLGLYFEALWQFLILAFPDTDLIARNLAVRDEGHTLGAFDLIFYCPIRRQPVHLELGVKFYLGLDPQHWFGPNTADRLDRKWSHLTERQIRLSQHPQARQLLSRLGIDHLACDIEFTGVLFYPVNSDLASPAGSHPQHLRGIWLNLRAIENYLPTGFWQILERQDWLSGWQDLPPDQLSPSELAERISLRLNRLNQPVQLACYNSDREDRRIIQRCIVVPDHWPAE